MSIKLQISPQQILRRLSIVALAISVISIITEYMVEFVLQYPTENLLTQFLDLFSVNLEGSLPTWYSTLLLFTVAALVILITIAKFRSEDGGQRWYWAGLGVIFLYLSADEGAAIHEIFVDFIKQTFNTTGFFEFGWQVVAIPVVVLVIILYARFVYRLPSQTRSGMILSSVIYLGGALIVEGISANQWSVDSGLSMRYLSIATVEELMEMLGAIGFIYTMLAYIVQQEYTFLFQHDTALATPRKTHPNRALRFNVLLLLVGLNIVVLGWMMWMLPHTIIADIDDEQAMIAVPFYYELQEQVIADGGVILEVPGVFGLENALSRQLGLTLIEQYPHVIAVSQPTRNVSTLIATHTLSFSQSDLTDLLHSFGQTNFILFDTETVRALSNIP